MLKCFPVSSGHRTLLKSKYFSEDPGKFPLLLKQITNKHDYIPNIISNPSMMPGFKFTLLPTTEGL